MFENLRALFIQFEFCKSWNNFLLFNEILNFSRKKLSKIGNLTDALYSIVFTHTYLLIFSKFPNALIDKGENPVSSENLSHEEPFLSNEFNNDKNFLYFSGYSYMKLVCKFIPYTCCIRKVKIRHCFCVSASSQCTDQKYTAKVNGDTSIKGRWVHLLVNL